MLFEMLIGEFKRNSTQCVQAVTRRYQTSVSIPNVSPPLSALYLSFSITPFHVGSITKGLIQSVHSEGGARSLIHSVCLLMNSAQKPRQIPVCSLAFKTARVECDSP